MLIDSSYFIGDIWLPGISGSGFAVMANAADLENSISSYERVYLERLLGVGFTDQLYGYIETINAALEQGDQEPENDESLDALIEVLQDKAKTPISPYVYFWHCRNNLSLTTGSGQSQISQENAVKVDNTDKMVRAWNNMVEKSKSVWDILTANSDDYPAFDQDRSFPFQTINQFNI